SPGWDGFAGRRLARLSITATVIMPETRCHRALLQRDFGERPDRYSPASLPSGTRCHPPTGYGYPGYPLRAWSGKPVPVHAGGVVGSAFLDPHEAAVRHERSTNLTGLGMCAVGR